MASVLLSDFDQLRHEQGRFNQWFNLSTLPGKLCNGIVRYFTTKIKVIQQYVPVVLVCLLLIVGSVKSWTFAFLEYRHWASLQVKVQRPRYCEVFLWLVTNGPKWAKEGLKCWPHQSDWTALAETFPNACPASVYRLLIHHKKRFLNPALYCTEWNAKMNGFRHGLIKAITMVVWWAVVFIVTRSKAKHA